MRTLTIQIPAGRGEDAERIATEHRAVNSALFSATSDGEPIEVLTASVSNRRVGSLLEALEGEIDGVRATFAPQGVFSLRPPPEEAPDQVVDVQWRSPVEVVLSGLQSIGSWRGLIVYAGAAGVIVWIGLYVSASYLLVGAMLIAPFAGPAMNAAIASAAGDSTLLGRSLLRYSVSLLTSVLVALLLSLGLLEAPTPMMLNMAKVTSYAVLLPLTAGAAGAVFLIQSQRDSLVSGAAVGVLVAASLAPPAGVVGMALALARWDLATDGAFVLVLQLVGINLSAASVFFLAGVRTNTQRYRRGSRGVFPASLAVAGLIAAGLLWWQFATPVKLQRGSLELAIAAEASEHFASSHPEATVLEASADFSMQRASQSDIAVVSITLAAPPAVHRDELGKELRDRLLREFPSVRPVVDLTVLELPPAGDERER